MRTQQIVDWLEERRVNCLRHASTKTGADRVGWEEDAGYFEAAISAIMAGSGEGGTD